MVKNKKEKENLESILKKANKNLFKKLKNQGVPLDNPEELMEYVEREKKINELALDLRKNLTEGDLQKFFEKALKTLTAITKEITIAQLKLRSKYPRKLSSISDFSENGDYMVPVSYIAKKETFRGGKGKLERRVYEEVLMREINDLRKPKHNPFYKCIEWKRTTIYKEKEDEKAYREGLIKKPGFGKRNRESYKRQGIYIPEDMYIESINVPITVDNNVVGVLIGSNFERFGEISEEEIRYMEKIAQFVGTAIYLFFKLSRFKFLAESMGENLARTLMEKPEILEGTKREITCCFADIENFTEYCNGKSSEEIMETIRELWNNIDPIIIKKYKGIISSHLGDGILFFFNALENYKQGDHAIRAINCALDIMKKVEDVNKKTGLNFKLKFGINTGEANVGNIGSSQKIEFSIIGPTVNLAKRLEEIARGGEIYVGKGTYKLTKKYFKFIEVIANIKGEMIYVYKLANKK